MPPPSAAFSRVTVVAPRTRIDLALPSDIAVATMLPMLLTLAGEVSRDGGGGHGGWCLAKLGGEELDPERSLSSLSVIDGDLLQLRHRSDSPPPPLFDDVVEAIAVAAPGSYRPWTPHTARTLGLVAAGLALLASAVLLLQAGTLQAGTKAGIDHGAVAVLAGAAAVVALIVGVVIAQVYGEASAGAVVAAGSLPLGFVSGLYLVSGGARLADLMQPPNLLLACTLTFALASISIMVLGAGRTLFIASATAAALGALAFLAASLHTFPAPGAVAAAAAAAALGGISALPRLTILLSRLPVPQVPTGTKDLKENPAFPDYTAIERRVGLAHEYLTGMIIGCGAVAALGAALAAAQGAVGIVLATVVAAALLLRARSYPNGNQAIALMLSGMVTVAGLMIRLLVSAHDPGSLLAGFGGLLGLATLALVTGVALPRSRFSPVLRRAVDVAEAALIASVLPLALGVMQLYQSVKSP
ncbi:MAG: type VII secretion integral membrane protein EccD [Pseudonocardiaceae bacterium]